MLVLGLLAGCAPAPVKPYDYTAFLANRPASILVLPPLNSSVDTAATYGVLSRTTLPLAESGYYVLPVAMVDEAFKQNGLTMPADMHQAPPAKLREIFGADAALYIDVKNYGSTYAVIGADITVTAKARLIDLRSGDLLWEGGASASTAEQQNHQQGLLVMLVAAVVSQIVNSLDDSRVDAMAATMSGRLLSARPHGLLYGPRSPKYKTD
jgi:hypothetical protein